MKLYNSRNKTVVEHPDHLAANILKYNHVKDNGIYCKADEIHKYFDTVEEPIVPDMPPRAPELPADPAPPAETPEPVKGTEPSVDELRAMAVEQLGIPAEQAAAMKKDELRDALEAKENPPVAKQ